MNQVITAFDEGGFFMYPILVFGIIALAIFVNTVQMGVEVETQEQLFVLENVLIPEGSLCESIMC